MRCIYAVLPFISKDKIPDPSTLEFWVGQLNGLAGFSPSLIMVRSYMNFMDGLLENAFTKLGYQIVEYHYPDEYDDFKRDKEKIMQYIRIHSEVSIESYQEIVCVPVKIPYNGYYQDTFVLEGFMDAYTIGKKTDSGMKFHNIDRLFEYVYHTRLTDPIFNFIDRTRQICKEVSFQDRIDIGMFRVYLVYMFVVQYSRFRYDHM